MLSLAVLFAVSTGIIPYKYVSCIPIQELDLESILQLAQSGQQSRNDKYSADSDETYTNSQYGSLKGFQLDDALKQVKESDSNSWQKKNYIYKNAEEGLDELSQSFKNRQAKEDKLTFGHYQDPARDFNENALEEDEEKQEANLYFKNNDYNLEDDSEKYKNSRYNQKALEQLLSENVLEKKYNENQQKLIPSTLLNSYDLSNDKDDEDSAGYSKIYVILNPQRVQKSRNKGKLNSLLTRILSLSSSSKAKADRENRYKGFALKGGFKSRRARHESREGYGGKDTMEEEYKPKRNRGERGNNGVGNGGRTAIPYIRHRGDIYERDN